ncbi:MAG: hypothetical protein APF76_10365 [Desulfitibacter sp. BRH_c19]|nr:MAG: hypothetical protein APF76_10365 [Desulfitibacter sp. BRH_c19]
MGELAYIKGVITNINDAYVHIEDRGYQFGEGVYEVIKVYNGKPFALRPHIQRLNKSAIGMAISFPWDIDFLEKEILKLLNRAELKYANIYMQVTPGAAPRSHLLEKAPEPNLVITIRRSAEPREIKGIKVITVDDIRWKKCWIKSTNLTANIMAKKTARKEGAGEAIMCETDGTVNEGGSSNLFAVIDGVLVTPKLYNKILAGITRDIVLQIAEYRNLQYKEDKLLIDDLRSAQEVLVTSTTFEITYVSHINNLIIGDGNPGTVTRAIYTYYKELVKQQCF